MGRAEGRGCVGKGQPVGDKARTCVPHRHEGVGARPQAPLTVMCRPPRRSALQQSAPYKIATPCDTPLPHQGAAFTCWGCL